MGTRALLETLGENQHGSVGRHTAPPRTTRTDRKSNGKEVRHQVDKKETYIQTGRRGRDGHRDGVDSCGRGGLRLAECGTNGAGSMPLADPAAPHSHTDKPRGPDSEWWRTGQAERRVAPLGPTFTHR